MELSLTFILVSSLRISQFPQKPISFPCVFAGKALKMLFQGSYSV